MTLSIRLYHLMLHIFRCNNLQVTIHTFTKQELVRRLEVSFCLRAVCHCLSVCLSTGFLGFLKKLWMDFHAI